MISTRLLSYVKNFFLLPAGRRASQPAAPLATAGRHPYSGHAGIDVLLKAGFEVWYQEVTAGGALMGLEFSRHIRRPGPERADTPVSSPQS